MNRVVIPTGYMESGSSAITDILREFKGFAAPHGSSEYIFLHCPNGVFDLEDKLLVGNNGIRSDEAIQSFRATMKELYSNVFWWPARYKYKVSAEFMRYVNEYIEQLVHAKSDNFWYYQEDRRFRAVPQLLLHVFTRKAFKGHMTIPMPLRYKSMQLSYPTPEEFYEASRGFLLNVYTDLGIEKNDLVLDQLLLPFNVWRMDNYFDDRAVCFVVERDPRDLFLINKYIMGKKLGIPVPYPTDVEAFCEFYRRMRSSEKISANPRVYRMHFEDLVYRYRESLKLVEGALGLSENDHANPKRLFNPDKSINNTQLFLNEAFHAEAKIIEERLPQYLYDFPYKRVADLKLCF